MRHCELHARDGSAVHCATRVQRMQPQRHAAAPVAPMNAAHTQSTRAAVHGARRGDAPGMAQGGAQGAQGISAHPAYALLSVLRTNVGRGCSSTPRSLDKQSPPRGKAAQHTWESPSIATIGTIGTHRCAELCTVGIAKPQPRCGQDERALDTARRAIPHPPCGMHATRQPAAADDLAVVVEGIEHELLQPTLGHHRHLRARET